MLVSLNGRLTRQFCIQAGKISLHFGVCGRRPLRQNVVRLSLTYVKQYNVNRTSVIRYPMQFLMPTSSVTLTLKLTV